MSAPLGRCSCSYSDSLPISHDSKHGHAKPLTGRRGSTVYHIEKSTSVEKSTADLSKSQIEACQWCLEQIRSDFKSLPASPTAATFNRDTPTVDMHLVRLRQYEQRSWYGGSVLVKAEETPQLPEKIEERQLLRATVKPTRSRSEKVVDAISDAFDKVSAFITRVGYWMEKS